MTPLQTLNPFESLVETIQLGGPVEAAKLLADQMRRELRFTELFEVLKMQHRLELGLPAVQIDSPGVEGPVLSVEQQDALDRRLIDACREVGSELIARGNLQEGWMYLRAVGDRSVSAKALANVQVTQENLDAMLGLLVHEAIDVARGTRLSLEMRGTCNTITMLDSVVSMRGRADQQAAVGELVQHVHAELMTSVKSDVMRREKLPMTDKSLEGLSIASLLASYPALLRDGSYHLDTTHLASTIRFARILDDQQLLRLAADIAEYGRQLHAQYQYPSEEPFADLYPMSLAFFRALLGEHIEGSLRLFLQKAESLDPNEHGTVAIETYADLLTRVGRPQEAMLFLIQRMPRGMRPFGIAPSLIELASYAKNFQPMLDHARERGDIVGFAAALFQSSSA